jgi:hypothetical protein
MCIEKQYPHLADLARNSGTGLDELSCDTKTTEQYMDLRLACKMVSQDIPRHGNAADHFSYLATLDEFLKQFNEREAPRKDVWRKLCVPGKSTEFLDTVSEAVIALQLRRASILLQLEVPFEPRNKRSKNADIVATLGSTCHWLDVKAIAPQGQMFSSNASFPLRSKEELIHDFVSRASDKYNTKFREAVTQGHADSVGIMLCLLKYEEAIAAFPELLFGAFLSIAPPQPIAPNELWANNPSLNLVWVYAVQKGPNTDVLVPIRVLNWMRPSEK